MVEQESTGVFQVEMVERCLLVSFPESLFITMNSMHNILVFGHDVDDLTELQMRELEKTSHTMWSNILILQIR